MITKSTPFSKLPLFRSTCAAIVSAPPATMPTLGLKEEWDGPKRKPPTSRTGPLVALALGALTLCFALSAAAQPPWGSGGTVTSPFKSADKTDLVCDLSDPRSNVEITARPSAEIPFPAPPSTEASLDISGLLVCREFDRVNETQSLPGLFRLNQLTTLVTLVDNQFPTRGFDFDEVCIGFDETTEACIEFTRTWTVTALYDGTTLGTDIRYELVAVDAAARGFCDPLLPEGEEELSEGEDCKVFYGLEDPLMSFIPEVPGNGTKVIEVETTTITQSQAVETPRPDVVWNLCHTQAFEVVPRQGNLFAATDHEEFSPIFGETGQDRLYRATTDGPGVTGSKIIPTDYPVNGLGEGDGFLFAGQPQDESFIPAAAFFPGNTLRRIDYSGNILTSVLADIPTACCNEEMVLFGGALYHAHYPDNIQKLDPDTGIVIDTFPINELVGMAVINNQIWISKWSPREVGIWDPGTGPETDTFTFVFSTDKDVFGPFERRNAGALAWDPLGEVLWVGLQNGNVIPVDLNGNPKGEGGVIQPFGPIPNTIDGLAFAFLSGEGNRPIDCTAEELVGGVLRSVPAVTESDEFVAEHQVQIEVVPTLNLNTGSSDAVLPAVVLGCKVEPDAIAFDPDGGPVFPAFAFVNGLTQFPITVERFSVNDTRSSPSCDGGEALDDLNLKLNKFDFIDAVKAAVPFCENRKASVPLSISVGNNDIPGIQPGFLGGTAVVDLSNCEVEVVE